MAADRSDGDASHRDTVPDATLTARRARTRTIHDDEDDPDPPPGCVDGGDKRPGR